MAGVLQKDMKPGNVVVNHFSAKLSIAKNYLLTPNYRRFIGCQVACCLTYPIALSSTVYVWVGSVQVSRQEGLTSQREVQCNGGVSIVL